MPVELTLVESVTELETTVVEVILESASAPGPAGAGVATGGTTGQVLKKASNTDFDTEWDDEAGAGANAPTDATYLVTTAHADLSAEVVVGATPGGELGGTWAAPTVDATHSGSSHASVQAAAEATAAAALAAHESDTTSVHGIADTSVLATDSEVATAVSDHSADTTSVHGIADTSALALTANHPTNATFNDHSARHENGGADEISLAGLDGTPSALQTHLDDATAAHAASAIGFTPAGTIAATDVQAAIEEVASEAGGGSGEALQREVTQTAHGFSVGEAVMFDGTDWALAQANSAANAEVVGLVAAVGDVDTFTLHYGGRITGLSGLTAGEVYYLDDDTAGLLTTTEPADVGDVSKPVLIADSTTSGYFFNWRGAEIGADALQAHLDDTTDAHDASAISVADSGGLLTATDVESALAEILGYALPKVLFDSTLGADTASVDTGAGGIAGGFDVLEVWIIARTSEAVDVSTILVTLNNDTGGNYDRQTVRGASTTASALAVLAGSNWAFSTAGDNQHAGACSVTRLTIPGYTQTTFHKTAEGNVALLDDTAANMRSDAQALRWRSTAAITRLAVAAGGGNLRAGSRLLIYGR